MTSQLDMVQTYQPYFEAYLCHGGRSSDTWQYLIWIRAQWVAFRRVDRLGPIGEHDRFQAWLRGQA